MFDLSWKHVAFPPSEQLFLIHLAKMSAHRPSLDAKSIIDFSDEILVESVGIPMLFDVSINESPNFHRTRCEFFTDVMRQSSHKPIDR